MASDPARLRLNPIRAEPVEARSPFDRLRANGLQSSAFRINNHQRLAIGLVGLVTLAVLSVLFWPFIAAEIIAPIALLAWLLLRIFVLSIGQQTYWYAAAFVLLLSLFRLWPRSPGNPSFEKHAGGNVAIKTFERWRSMFLLTDHDLHSLRNLRWELVRLLLSLYATKQHSEADLKLHEALQRREIDLPDSIHAFLFAGETPAKPRSFLRRMLDFWLFPLKWARHRALQQQERAECHRRIDDVLCFLEKSLEMNDDDRRRKQDQY